MKQYSRHLTVEQICGLFGKTRQSWYERTWRHADQQLQDELVLHWVREIRGTLPRVGCIKLHRMLGNRMEEHGIHLGRDGFFTLLRDHDLLIRVRKKYVHTTDSRHRYKKLPNVLQEITVHQPEQVWVSDITYLRTVNGFIYLFLVTDAWSRKIMGYHVSQRLKANGCIIALNKALQARNYPKRPLMHHSDRGVQYCCDDYVELLQRNKITISMTESGSPYDNAIAERINGILKQEFDLDITFSSYGHAVGPVMQAIHSYNNIRPHFSCDLKTPAFVHMVQQPSNHDP